MATPISRYLGLRDDDIVNLIWRLINDTEEVEVSHWTDGTPYYIQPGEIRFNPAQYEFLCAMYQYDAVLFGGAAGGGKTYILIWALILILIKVSAEFKAKAIEMKARGIPYDEAKPRVVLFSRTYQMLEDRHIKEFFNYVPEWMGTMYGSKPPEFHLIDELGGGELLFRNLEEPDNYKSVQFAAIGFDELTENEEYVWHDIKIRKRFTGVQHIPMIAATNPTGPGRTWAKRLFVDPATSVKPVYDPQLKISSKGYKYIPCRPTENPFQTKEYLLNLKQGEEKRKLAYYDGSWEAFEGQYFLLYPDVHQFSRFLNVEGWGEWPIFGAIDDGYDHPTAMTLSRIDPSGTQWVFYEYSVAGQDAEYHKKHIAEQLEELGIDRDEIVGLWGDPKMWRESHTGQGDATWAEIFKRKKLANGKPDPYGSFNIRKAKIHDQKRAVRDLKQALSFDCDWVTDENGIARRKITRRPRLMISERCPLTWQSFQNQMSDPNNPDAIESKDGRYMPGEGDDELKTVLYTFRGAVRKEEGDQARSDRDRKRFEDKTRDHASSRTMTYDWS